MRAIAACLATLALLASAVDAAALEAVVRKPSVDVLAAPQFGAAVVAALKRDAAVSIAEQSGLWYRLALPEGKSGFVRVNDVRVSYASAEQGSANLRALTTGKAGQGRVTETAGVRGIDESDLQAAPMDASQLEALVAYRTDAAAAARYAAANAWEATAVAYDAEAKPAKAKGSSGSTSQALDAAAGVSSLFGSVGQDVGSLLGTSKKVVPRPEQEQAAEELALGPEIAGRVLGARPLWNDPDAQRRVNVVGRWVASQTSRADLPWTFGIIDTPELNAFAAPGGYVLITRGLYELLDSDAELAGVLGHEAGHCVQRDHFEVIRKQQLGTLGKDELSSRIDTGSGTAETLARQYVESQGATIMLTALDRDAEFRADRAAEIYLSRAGLNPVSYYSVLQRMAALGERSASLAQLYKTHPPLHVRLDRIDERGYRGLEAYLSRP